MSAPYLIASKIACNAKTIVHIHNTSEAVPVAGRFKRFILQHTFRRICLSLADKILGVSNHTLDSFLHGKNRVVGRDYVCYSGVDATPFTNAQVDGKGFRLSLGLPEDASLMLFAGRMVPEKKPAFALEVLKKLRETMPSTVGIFVGSGSEEQSTKSLAKSMDLEQFTRFLGWRSDIPEIMSSCDVFIHCGPETPKEGFGLAVVEAQLAGLRLIVSEGIGDDALLKESVFTRLSVEKSPHEWASAVASLFDRSPPTRQEVAKQFRETPMDMDNSLNNLLGHYRN
jgi:glycosyltransferase involved in cell wall biosynthesis